MAVEQRHAMIQQIEPIEIRQSSPLEFRIAPEDGKLLAVFSVQTLCLSNPPGHFRRRYRAIEKQADIDIAVDFTESAVSKAAKFVGVDQRRAELRLKILGDAREITIDLCHCLVPNFTRARDIFKPLPRLDIYIRFAVRERD